MLDKIAPRFDSLSRCNGFIGALWQVSEPQDLTQRLTDFLTELLTDPGGEQYLCRVVAEAGGGTSSSAEAQLEGLRERS